MTLITLEGIEPSQQLDNCVDMRISCSEGGRSPRRWLELVTNVSNEEDVGPDSLRRVCLIEAVEYPTVLCQRRSFRQGDAGVSPGCSSVAVEGASGKVRHEGAVRVMAEGAGPCR